MSELRIGIVIVHWHGMDDLLECLRSVAALETGGVAEVAIGLNTRDEFDEAAVRAICPGVTIAESTENLGYAGGCNLGWRALRGRRLDAVLFLNNDVVVEPSLANEIAAAFVEHPSAGIVGPVVTYYDEPARVWFAGGVIDRTFGYTRHTGLGRETLPSAGREVDFVNGCAIAVRFEALERLGGFDESYFHFFDEVDLCERARAVGYASWLTASPSVRHKVSASTGVRGSNRFNRRQAYYFCRNRVRFVRRDFAGWSRVRALCAQPALVAYECAQAMRARNWPALFGRIEGLLSGILGGNGPGGGAA